MKLQLGADGSVFGVYSDALRPLAARLGGGSSIKRASDVEFNAGTGQWEARLTGTGELVATSPNRASALRQEVTVLEADLGAAARRHGN